MPLYGTYTQSQGETSRVKGKDERTTKVRLMERTSPDKQILNTCQSGLSRFVYRQVAIKM